MYADLSEANLSEANLKGADLLGAHFSNVNLIIDGGYDTHGHRWIALIGGKSIMISARDTWLSPDDAKKHWTNNVTDDPKLRDECLIRIEYLLKLAELRLS